MPRARSACGRSRFPPRRPKSLRTKWPRCVPSRVCRRRCSARVERLNQDRSRLGARPAEAVQFRTANVAGVPQEPPIRLRNRGDERFRPVMPTARAANRWPRGEKRRVRRKYSDKRTDRGEEGERNHGEQEENQSRGKGPCRRAGRTACRPKIWRADRKQIHVSADNAGPRTARDRRPAISARACQPTSLPGRPHQKPAYRWKIPSAFLRPVMSRT